MPRRSRRPRSLLPLLAVSLLGACAARPPAVTAAIGYTRLAVRGELALDGDAQDVGGAFGLGAQRSSPYVRADVDCGVPRFAVSGFWIHEQGDGVLAAPFGGLPAGTAVATDLDLGNAKLAAVLATQLGPVTVAPGVAVDVFAIDFRASSSPGNREEVDEVVAVPLPMLRLEAEAGPLALRAELAWLDAHALGVDARFADAEAALAWRLGRSGGLLAGYRLLIADAEGDSATDAIGIDLAVRGWFVGGAVSF